MGNSVGEFYTDKIQKEEMLNTLCADVAAVDVEKLRQGNPEVLKAAADILAGGKLKDLFENSVDRYEKSHNSRRRFLGNVGLYGAGSVMFGGGVSTLQEGGREVSDASRAKQDTEFQLQMTDQNSAEGAQLKKELNAHTNAEIDGQGKEILGAGFMVAGTALNIYALNKHGKDTLSANEFHSLSSAEKKHKVAVVVDALAMGLAVNVTSAARLQLPSPKQGMFSQQVRGA